MEFTINGIVIDGKRGLFKALGASRDLKKIVFRLTSTTQTKFENKLDSWYRRLIWLPTRVYEEIYLIFSPIKTILI